jgi:hypothetical protein
MSRDGFASSTVNANESKALVCIQSIWIDGASHANTIGGLPRGLSRHPGDLIRNGERCDIAAEVAASRSS